MVKPQPVKSINNLRDRVERLLQQNTKNKNTGNQLSLALPLGDTGPQINPPKKSIREFLNFMTSAIPDGDVYLFGGVLRDLALLGKRGFNSDIDVVVEGDWLQFTSYLDSLQASKNKFGGYRLWIDSVPIDIWNAQDTWAIKNELVSYNGIASLTETTVLNWDAILMNWRTRNFIFREGYFEQLKSRVLDIVLEDNPNPLGMMIRVFRHLCLKDARQITPRAAKYLAINTKKYKYEEVKNAEMRSYNNSIIASPLYRFFECIDNFEEKNLKHQFSVASKILMHELKIPPGTNLNTRS